MTGSGERGKWKATCTLELLGPQAGSDNGSCSCFLQVSLARRWERALSH